MPRRRRYTGVFFAVFLFLIFLGWFSWSLQAEKRERREYEKRVAQKVALRRQLAINAPDSPAALEMLGDSFREAEMPTEALSCYERAEALESERIASGKDTGNGAGLVAGAGLATKIRLARLEMAQAAGTGPLAHGNTLATRQQVCRQCGQLCSAQGRTCENCGAALLVDTMQAAWREDHIRRPILKQAANHFGMLMVILVALSIASALPLDVRGALGIAAAIVLGWRFLRAVGGD